MRFSYIAGPTIFLTLIGCANNTASAQQQPPTTQPTGVAVVELFTSEGCSSCPPAEAVLGDIADARDGRPVYALAFHVDYWNSLGWPDRFSFASFSQRQWAYSRALGLNEVYTPQMIVNGRKQFVGSDRAAATNAIAAALAEPAPSPVRLSITNSDGPSTVHCAVSNASDGTVVHVAVVEQGLSSNVRRGENAGRVLRDPAVVRWFDTVSLRRDAAGSGTAFVTLPPLPKVRHDHASVIVYVQRTSDQAITGAALAPMPMPMPMR